MTTTAHRPRPAPTIVPRAVREHGEHCEHREEPSVLLRRLQRAHTAAWARHVGTALTAAQFSVLAVVARHPDTDQGTVGTLTGLDRATTSDVCARLEKRHLLARTAMIGDGRRKLLTLTPPGTRLLAEITARAAAFETLIISPPTLCGVLIGCHTQTTIVTAYTDPVTAWPSPIALLTDLTEHLEQLAQPAQPPAMEGRPR